MTLLTPLALLAGLAIPAIILLMLKKRTRPQTVSSIMLWLRLERLNIPALRLSRLLRSLLLALQILVALVLVLALARPVVTVIGGVSRTSVIIIDTSMSMAVAEKGGTRLELAKDQVRAMIRGKAPGDRLALIAMGDEAVVVSGFNVNAATLLQALDRIQVDSARANPDAALALAENMAKAEGGAHVILFSAGCFSSFARLPEADFSFVAVGGAEVGNLLLEDVVADGEQVYVSVYNNGTRPLAAQVEVRDAAGVPVGRRGVELPPGERKVLVWRNLPQSSWYKAVLISADDQVALDNEFYALTRSDRPRRLLLVSAGNLFGAGPAPLSPPDGQPRRSRSLYAGDGGAVRCLCPGRIFARGIARCPGAGLRSAPPQSPLRHGAAGTDFCTASPAPSPYDLCRFQRSKHRFR